jgi:hypothetical protein
MIFRDDGNLMSLPQELVRIECHKHGTGTLFSISPAN